MKYSSHRISVHMKVLKKLICNAVTPLNEWFLYSLPFSDTVYKNGDWLNVWPILWKQTDTFLIVDEFTVWEGAIGDPSTLDALPCIALPVSPLASLQALGLPTLWRCLHPAWHHHACQLSWCTVIPSNDTQLFPERGLWLWWTVQGEITALGPRFSTATKHTRFFQHKLSTVDFRDECCHLPTFPCCFTNNRVICWWVLSCPFWAGLGG